VPAYKGQNEGQRKDDPFFLLISVNKIEKNESGDDSQNNVRPFD